MLTLFSSAFSSSASSNFVSSDYKIKSEEIIITKDNKRGHEYKAIGNDNTGYIWLFTNLFYDDSNYTLASINSKKVNNHDVTIATYADNNYEIIQKTRKNVAYTVGSEGMGISYSMDESASITSSFSTGFTGSIGEDANCVIAEVSASVSEGVGMYINSSLGTGTTIEYEIDYSFPAITPSERKNGITYSLYEEVREYHFIDITIIDGKTDYLYVEYTGIVGYSCEKIGG